MLEKNTDAKVFTTLRYGGIGFGVRDRIPAITRDAVLLTTPPTKNDSEAKREARVNLRWVLANHLFTAPKAADARKSLFISFHIDSLHKDRMGSMVYVPAATMLPSKYSWAGDGHKVAELKRGASISFSERQKIESETQSRIFADGLLKALRKEGIAVNPNRPIRNAIHRGKKPYVPAVIRNNVATTKILIEIVNIQNESDATLLKDPNFRERYAEAVVAAIRAHYGNRG